MNFKGISWRKSFRSTFLTALIFSICVSLLVGGEEAEARRRRRKKRQPKVPHFIVYPISIRGAAGEKLIKKFLGTSGDGCSTQSEVKDVPRGLDRKQVSALLERTFSGEVGCQTLENAAELAEYYDLGIVVPKFKSLIRPELKIPDRIPIQLIAIRVVSHLGSQSDAKEAQKYFRERLLSESATFSYLALLERAVFGLEPGDFDEKMGVQISAEREKLEKIPERTIEDDIRLERLKASDTEIQELKWASDLKRKIVLSGDIERLRLLSSVYLAKNQGLAIQELRRWAVRWIKREASTQSAVREQLIGFFAKSSSGSLEIGTSDEKFRSLLSSDQVSYRSLIAIEFFGGHRTSEDSKLLSRLEKQYGTDNDFH